MKDAPIGKEFVFHDGKKVRNIPELYEYLRYNGHNVFYDFVDSQKNDFANWIEYVLEDKEMSSKIRQAKNLEETMKILAPRPPIEASPIIDTMAQKILSKEASITEKESPHPGKIKGGLQNIPHEDGIYSTSKDEKKDESRKEDASKGWFKNVQRKIEEKRESREDIREVAEKDATPKNIGDDAERDRHQGENAQRLAWVTLYILVVALIILLVIYKFVLS